jgi:hypothetical protein
MRVLIYHPLLALAAIRVRLYFGVLLPFSDAAPGMRIYMNGCTLHV